MKQQKLTTLALVIATSMVIVACNPLKKMAKRAGEVNYSVTPNPVEMHGDSIQISVKGSFPSKYFHKKVSADITPVLKYGESEQSFKVLTLAGEDSEAEGVKIPYDNGGSFEYTSTIAYKDGMQQAELFLNMTGKFKGKTKEFDPVKVADGTVVTPLLVQDDDQPVLGEDNFKKVIPMTSEATIHYVVNRHYVRPSELRDDDVDAMRKDIKEWAENERMTFKGLTAVGYASPEGEISFNENLAADRAASGAKAIKRYLSRADVEGAGKEAFYTEQDRGEDWEGFKEAMEASEIKDKDLILRVLKMYDDVKKREQEIRNIAKTYKVIEDEILPDLRRTELTLNVDRMNLTDEEIKPLADSNPDSLTEEQLLYAATLTNDLDKKLKVYRSFVKVYPEDWRGPNNVGYILVLQNKVSDAKTQFGKADQMDADNPVIQNNLGVIARLNGDLDQAMTYYDNASGAGQAVKQNKGLVNIIRGDYSDAVSNYGSTKSFNAALAQVLNGDSDKALETLKGSEDKTTAEAHYLMAIIGARTDNNDLLISNLKVAVEKDASFKEKAKTDAEFLDYMNNSDFQAAVN